MPMTSLVVGILIWNGQIPRILQYHMCIFDVMMPKKDGFSLAQDVRKLNANVPILFLSAKSSDEDKVLGFKSGGDDYLTKPFNTEELQLRVAAMLRRVNIETVSANPDVHQLGDYVFDTVNYTLSQYWTT